MTAATINQLIEQINREKIYKEIFSKITKNDEDSADLWQDLMLIFLDHKNTDMLVEMYNRKEFKYFFIRVLMNQFNSKTSPFYTNYKKNAIEITYEQFYSTSNEIERAMMLEEFYHEMLIEKKERLEKTIEYSQQALKEENWYNKLLFEMYYLKGMSYGQISKETLIPKTSVYQSIISTYSRVTNKLK